MSPMDLATETNLKELVEVGKALLKGRVMRMNLDTSKYEPIPEDVTNDQELERWLKVFKYFLWISWITINLIVSLFVHTGSRTFSRRKGN